MLGTSWAGGSLRFFLSTPVCAHARVGCFLIEFEVSFPPMVQGANNYGGLGLGPANTTDITTPAAVYGNNTWVSLDMAGWYYICAIDTSYLLFCWVRWEVAMPPSVHRASA